jgi:hypothetical protein
VLILEKIKAYQIIATPDDDCVMEDFDISKPSFIFTEQETVCQESLQRADGFLKIDGRFYREFEYLCSAAIIIQNLTNRLSDTQD